jgi:hypothetical protein
MRVLLNSKERRTMIKVFLEHVDCLSRFLDCLMGKVFIEKKKKKKK